LDELGRAIYTNRLILESSPYLLQHAHNPVDWYPWGEEAFEAAARTDKPIFLSIGYSTCHWCHVMEEESFDDPTVAAALNASFIAIKVDREQRPDLDDIYMTAVQLMGRRGGWPMSSFLTSEGRPFFGGTYYPPDRFLELLAAVDRAWVDERDSLVTTAERLAEAVRDLTSLREQGAEVDDQVLDRAAAALVERHDRELGGFGAAPKFPHEAELLFLADRALRTGDDDLISVVEHSLDAMARGGLHDQVGGGFHRYSTDAQWLVPHFEKMLYNQAQMVRAYLAGYRLTGRGYFERVARHTLAYVLREMTSPEGTFYSATDADSEGEEGSYFVWTPAEMQQVLGDDASLAAEVFGVSEDGNFEGRSILFLPKPFDEVARLHDMPLESLLDRVDGWRESLRAARADRVAPLRDEKILTAWNGMMIVALCDGWLTLRDPVYRTAALRAGEQLWLGARRGPGRLWRVRLGALSTTPGLQEDYAQVAEAFAALYDISGQQRWLDRAREVLDGMHEQFWDPEQGGYFATSLEIDQRLIARPKSLRDGAEPSGNSVALRALRRVAQQSGEAALAARADALAGALAGDVARSPSSHSYLLFGGFGAGAEHARQPVWAARGRVRIEAALREASGGLEAVVVLQVAPGWHLNSSRPHDSDLVPTAFGVAEGRGWSLGEVSYPAGEDVALGFRDRPLSVYQGAVRLTARVTRGGATASRVAAPLTLTLQACDERACLRPEQLEIVAPVGSGADIARARF
jgi:uncharacterized protein YyaL (SSP411 family)